MDIDKSWMNARGIFLPEYRNGVRNFIEFARPKADSGSRIKCPCKRCVNMVYRHISLVEEHLLRYGMDKKYTRWVWHGEGDPYEVVRNDPVIEDDSDDDEPVQHDGIGSLLDELHQGFQSNVPLGSSEAEGSSDHEPIPDESDGISEQLAKLVRDAREPLYPNCMKFSKLGFLIKLLHIKSMNRWSQKSFDQNLTLIKAALPDGEKYRNHILKQSCTCGNWDLVIFLYMLVQMTVYYFIKRMNMQLYVRNVVSLGIKPITGKEKGFLIRF